MKDIIKKCLPTYKVVDKIGEGIHDSVYRVNDNLKQRAVKIVPIRVERSRLYRTETDLDSKVSQDFHAVREYYEKIKGNGVIGVYDFHLVDKMISKKEALAHLVILMELCPVNLQEFVIDNYPLTCNSAVTYMTTLSSVLDRLFKHSGDIFLLTDFKPSNLLITDDKRLVIGDLGGLKRLSSVSTITNAQFTPNWSAPELVMMGERPSIQSAVYSYGLVSYYIWEGQLPHEEEDFIERIRRIKEKDVSYTNDNIPDGIRNLISRCLKFSPEERPGSFEEILGLISQENIESDNSHLETLISGNRNLRNNNTSDPDDFTRTVDLGNYAAKPDSSRSRIIPVSNPPKTWKEPVTGIDFVWVEGGKFQMGALTDDPDSASNEKPAHEVDVQGFWIGRYPVTQEQWKLVMGTNPSHFIKTPEHPVEQITWDDALRFCSRLNANTTNGNIFGLPQEKEWEYAARSGGKEELYAGGADINDFAWYKTNSNHTTHPVGQKEPNGLGLFDMCGNILEWCDDAYYDDAYKRMKQSNVLVQGSGERVVRGGGYNLDAKRCRASARRRMSQALKYINLGMRIVMIPDSGR